jgi:hypothetical protein
MLSFPDISLFATVRSTVYGAQSSSLGPAAARTVNYIDISIVARDNDDLLYEKRCFRNLEIQEKSLNVIKICRLPIDKTTLMYDV